MTTDEIPVMAAKSAGGRLSTASQHMNLLPSGVT